MEKHSSLIHFNEVTAVVAEGSGKKTKGCPAKNIKPDSAFAAVQSSIIWTRTAMGKSGMCKCTERDYEMISNLITLQ